MTPQDDLLAANQHFFASLIEGDGRAVGHIVADDFMLVDMMNGSIIDKPLLISIIDTRQLEFETIEPAELRVRRYQDTAVVTGRIRAKGCFGGTPFAGSSRYTHVYVMQKGQWRLVSAQGTQITAER